MKRYGYLAAMVVLLVAACSPEGSGNAAAIAETSATDTGRSANFQIERQAVQEPIAGTAKSTNFTLELGDTP